MLLFNSIVALAFPLLFHSTFSSEEKLKPTADFVYLNLKGPAAMASKDLPTSCRLDDWVNRYEPSGKQHKKRAVVLQNKESTN